MSGDFVTDAPRRNDSNDGDVGGIYYAPIEPGAGSPFVTYRWYWSDRIVYARKEILDLTQEELSRLLARDYDLNLPRVTLAKYETRPPKRYSVTFDRLVDAVIDLVRVRYREGWTERAMENRAGTPDFADIGITTPASDEEARDFIRRQVDSLAMVRAAVDVVGGFVRATEDMWRNVLPLPPNAFDGVPHAPDTQPDVPPNARPFYFGFDVGLILAALITGRTYREVLEDRASDESEDECRARLAHEEDAEYRLQYEVGRRAHRQIDEWIVYPMTDEEFDQYDAWETAKEAHERAAKKSAKKKRSGKRA